MGLRLFADRAFQCKARVARLSSYVRDVFPRTFGHCPFGRFRATTRRAILFGRNWQSGLTSSTCWGITEEERRRHSMQSLQYIRAHARKIGPFRWILLLWIGFVYLWGVLWGGGMSEQITPHALILFTLLMLLHFSLYGVSSFTRAFPAVSTSLLCHPGTADCAHQSCRASFHRDAGPLSRAGRRNSQPAP